MSLKFNELRSLVSKTIHIDEYKSKMGDDSDVIVFSFKIKYFNPAVEFSNFLEKGYDWVLDADVSSGEMDDGSYIVFVECLRRPSFPTHLIAMLNDLEGATGIKAYEYTFAYHKSYDYIEVTKQNLKALVPLSPRQYKETIPQEKKPDMEDKEVKEQIAAMKDIARIKHKPAVVTTPEVAELVKLSGR